MVKKSGVKIDVEVYSSLIPDGKDWLVYEIVHDITIRNRYFEAMEAQNKILKDIAWTQSHLVRAPLARILGLVDLLKEREYAEMSHDQIIQLICTSSEELDAVIRDVSEKAYLAGQFEPVDEALVQEETMIISVAPEVLLVDDDRIILTMHKGAVVKQGLTEAPYLFMNGETAYQHLLDNDAEMKVFIVFLDLNMPVMDGWQFLEKLEKVSWKSVIKVVVLTSSVDTADRIRAQQYRYVVSYQNKPVNASMISELRYHPELKSYWPQ
jgi:CheY-like chemotaxis protein